VRDSSGEGPFDKRPNDSMRSVGRFRFLWKSTAQVAYQTITVKDDGTITGSVKWSGPVPKIPSVLINKDPDVCDPQSLKKRDLERLVIDGNGGVANTLVFLKNVTKSKAMALPEGR